MPLLKNGNLQQKKKESSLPLPSFYVYLSISFVAHEKLDFHHIIFNNLIIILGIKIKMFPITSNTIEFKISIINSLT